MNDGLTEKEEVSLTLDSTNENKSIKPYKHTKLYKRRWVMLLVFSCYSFSNAYQWIHLNIIANQVKTFWNESIPGDSYSQQMAVDWLSMVYMLAYIPLITPANWLLDRKGLRVVCIVGSLLNCTGAWLKCVSVSPDRFAVLMLAQTICACAQLFILGIPAKLAAVWFGPNEVSTATAIGVFGNQVGVAFGFGISPLLVPASIEDHDTLGQHFRNQFYGVASVTTVLAIIILFVFKKSPPVPPSLGQLALEKSSSKEYFLSLRKLMMNPGFVILTISYGINVGSYYAISTLLEPIMTPYFPGRGQEIGWVGFTIVLSGVLGSIVAGVWLDKTKTYKLTTVLIYVCTLVCMAILTGTLHFRLMWLLFVIGFALGFFMTGYLPVGFEFAAEITYPESEGTTSGILNASAQVFGIILTMSISALIDKVSILSGNLAIVGILFLGTILTALIKGDMRRQRAHAEVHCSDQMSTEDNNVA